MRRHLPSGPGPPHCRGFEIILRRTTLGKDSSRRMFNPTQRPLPNNQQHSQQTDIHATGGIRIRNPSKRAAAHPHLRPCGHRDRQNKP